MLHNFFVGANLEFRVKHFCTHVTYNTLWIVWDPYALHAMHVRPVLTPLLCCSERGTHAVEGTRFFWGVILIPIGLIKVQLTTLCGVVDGCAKKLCRNIYGCFAGGVRLL